MGDGAFNPYHKWLGIPLHEQPADYYRLLGVQRFESDPDVIDHAAAGRMAVLRSVQLGQNTEWSQRLLSEIAAARVCLVDPPSKLKYDAQLRSAMVQPPDGTAIPPPLRPQIATSQSWGTHAVMRRPAKSSHPRREPSPSHLVRIIVGGIAGIVLAIPILQYVFKKDVLGIFAESRPTIEGRSTRTTPQTVPRSPITDSGSAVKSNRGNSSQNETLSIESPWKRDGRKAEAQEELRTDEPTNDSGHVVTSSPPRNQSAASPPTAAKDSVPKDGPEIKPDNHSSKSSERSTSANDSSTKGGATLPTTPTPAKENAANESAPEQTNVPPVANVPVTKTPASLPAAGGGFSYLNFLGTVAEETDRIAKLETTAQRDAEYRKMVQNLDQGIKSRTARFHFKIRDVKEASTREGDYKFEIEPPQEAKGYAFVRPGRATEIKLDGLYGNNLTLGPLTQKEATAIRPGDTLELSGNPRFGVEALDGRRTVTLGVLAIQVGGIKNNYYFQLENVKHRFQKSKE